MSILIPGPAGLLQVAEQLPESRQELITAIICHPHPLFGGTMDNKVVTTLAKACELLGIATLRFNYRGVEQSAGAYGNLEGEVQDCQAVIDWVRHRRPQDRLWLMGFSFGAYIATRNAINNPQVAQLVTVAPSVEHADFDALPQIPCPWLIIMGDEDEIVPPQAVYDFAARRPEHPTLIKMEGTSHFFHKKLIELRNALVEYLNPRL